MPSGPACTKPTLRKSWLPPTSRPLYADERALLRDPNRSSWVSELMRRQESPGHHLGHAVAVGKANLRHLAR